VDTAFAFVRDFITSAIEKVKEVLNWFGTLPELFRGWLQGANDAIGQGIGNVIQWFRDLPGNVLTALGNIGTFLYESGAALIQGFWDGLKSVWNTVVRWVEDSMAWLRGFWPFSPAKRGAFAGRGYVTYSGKALMGDFAESIRKSAGTLGRAAEQAMMGVREPFSEPLDVQMSASFERDIANMPRGMSADIQHRVTSDDFGGPSVDDMEAAFGRAFDNRTLRVDGSGVAKLVRKDNTRHARR
jgi:hypothetical protein